MRRSTAAPIEQMYRDHYAVIRGYFLRHAPEAADDLTSDTFLKALRSPYDDKGKPLNWLSRVAHSVLIQRARWLSVIGRTAWSIDRLPSSPWFYEPGFDEFARDETLHDLLAPLTPGQRRVLELRFVDEYTPAEIAALMGTNEGAVRALQFRGLRAIQQHLDSTGGIRS